MNKILEDAWRAETKKWLNLIISIKRSLI
jgi:hypothetical protein